MINKFILKDKFECIFLKGYFNDVLAGVFLWESISIIAILKRNDNYIQTEFIKIMILTIIIGFFWEYITPFYKVSSTSDPLDLLSYVIGSIIYWLVIKIWFFLFKNKK